MKNTTENRKIVLGHNGAKGYEIKKVMESWNGSNEDDVTEVYISKEAYDNYINADERDKESFIHGFSGEANEIEEEIRGDKDIDTQLISLNNGLAYAETLPYEQMKEEVQNAMKHIDSIRAEHNEKIVEDNNKKEALINEVGMFDVGQQSKPTRGYQDFDYKPHTNLIDDAAEQLSKHYNLSFTDARGAMEQAIKEVETLPKYDYYRNNATNKIDFKEVVKYAVKILNPLPF